MCHHRGAGSGDPSAAARTRAAARSAHRRALGLTRRRIEQREYAAARQSPPPARPRASYSSSRTARWTQSRHQHGAASLVATLAEGDHFGAAQLVYGGEWPHSFRAVTPCVTLALTRQAFEQQLSASARLRAHVDTSKTPQPRRHNR